MNCITTILYAELARTLKSNDVIETTATNIGIIYQQPNAIKVEMTPSHAKCVTYSLTKVCGLQSTFFLIQLCTVVNIDNFWLA